MRHSGRGAPSSLRRRMTGARRSAAFCGTQTVTWWRSASQRRPDRGIMWVIFDHLRPSGHIMPDHVGDRGAGHLDPGASRSPTYQACADVHPAGRRCTKIRSALLRLGNNQGRPGGQLCECIGRTARVPVDRIALVAVASDVLRARSERPERHSWGVLELSTAWISRRYRYAGAIGRSISARTGLAPKAARSAHWHAG
jgi:hypothetical protein